MAHPEQEAVEADTNSGDPLDDIAKFIDDEPEDLPDEGGDNPEDTDLTDDDLPDEGEEEQQDAEPEAAIRAPVSLNKEQREAFAQLPPELQKVWADGEAQRNREVQAKTTEAAEAKRNAQAVAQAELAQIQRQYADELEIYASAFKPVKPDYSLLATDPQAFAIETAQYEQLSAQYDQLMQQVARKREEADQFDHALWQHNVQQEQAKIRAEWPDFADPAKAQDVVATIQSAAELLGRSMDSLRNADAQDILNLKLISELKGKADKYDALMSRKMANVRAAKALPKVATPGTVPSRNPSKAQRSDAAWQRARSSKSGEDYADFLEASGVKL